jgi:hypothetical protein
MRWQVWILTVFICVSALAWTQERDEAAARQLFANVNRERQQRNLPPLRRDNSLTNAATGHTERMSQSDKLSHQFSNEPPLGQRLATAGARLSGFGENVGFSTYGADDLHREWMSSAGHRANILNPAYNVVGIAVFHKGEKFYAAEDFGTELTAISADDADLKVRDAIAQARQASHLPALRLEVNEGGHPANCSARPFNASALAPGHARSIVNFTTVNPRELPAELGQRLSDPKWTSYAISVCELQDPKGFTTMSVRIALFD